MFPHHNLESKDIFYQSKNSTNSINTRCSSETLDKSYKNSTSDIFYQKYSKYKKKYLSLKYGGALPSSTIPKYDKEKPKLSRSKSVGYETNVDPTTLACKNITDRDPITLDPITSIPSNRLIILQSGRCVDVFHFLGYRISDKKYRDPMTRDVFSNDIINKAREKLLELNKTVPTWMNDYDENIDQYPDEVNDYASDSDSEEEFIYEPSDEEFTNEPTISKFQLQSDAVEEVSTSPYNIDKTMIMQAQQQFSLDDLNISFSIFNYIDENNGEQYYNAEILNILYKLVKFNKSGIDNNRAKKLALLLYLSTRNTIYGIEPYHPSLKFISNNFAGGGLDFSGVFNKLKNEISVERINELINEIFPINDIPLNVLSDPQSYWQFMKYNNTTNSYQYRTLVELDED